MFVQPALGDQVTHEPLLHDDDDDGGGGGYVALEEEEKHKKSKVERAQEFFLTYTLLLATMHVYKENPMRGCFGLVACNEWMSLFLSFLVVLGAQLSSVAGLITGNHLLSLTGSLGATYAGIFLFRQAILTRKLVDPQRTYTNPLLVACAADKRKKGERKEVLTYCGIVGSMICNWKFILIQISTLTVLFVTILYRKSIVGSLVSIVLCEVIEQASFLELGWKFSVKGLAKRLLTLGVVS